MKYSAIALLVAIPAAMISTVNGQVAYCTNTKLNNDMQCSQTAGQCCGDVTKCSTKTGNPSTYASVCFAPGSLTAPSSLYSFNGQNCTQSCYVYSGYSQAPIIS